MCRASTLAFGLRLNEMRLAWFELCDMQAKTSSEFSGDGNTNSPLVVSPAGCSMSFSSAGNVSRRRGVSELCCDRTLGRLRGRELVDELCQPRLVSCRFIGVDQVLGSGLIELLDRDQQGRLGVIDRLLSRGDSSGRRSHLLNSRSQRGSLLLVADATTFVFSEGTSGATSVRHKVVNQKTVQ